MTDSITAEAVPEDLSTVSSSQKNNHFALPPSDSSKSRDLRAIQDVVSRYVSQLLYGCGDSTCTGSVCDTGRRNATQRPVRKYTPRSARAIALTLASGPKPRSRFCRKDARLANRNVQDVPESPKDPSAFVQHLSDTKSIRALCNPPDGPETDGTNSTSSYWLFRTPDLTIAISEWHSKLDELSNSIPALPETFEELSFENEMIALCLNNCMKWLLGTLDRGHAHERIVYIVTSLGFVYPPRAITNGRWPEVIDEVDSYEHGPSFRLACRVVHIASQRSAVESEILPDAYFEPLPLEIVAIRKTPRLNWHLALQITAGKTELRDWMDIVVWLKKVFLHHWGGEIILTEGTLACTSLLLMEQLYFRCLAMGSKDEDILPMVFFTPAISARLDPIELARTYRKSLDRTVRHILSFNFLFSIDQEATYFRTMHHLEMRRAHSDAVKAAGLRGRTTRLHPTLETQPQGRLKYLEDHYLLLNVSRENVLRDAFDQLWQRRSSELRRPLRVRLGEVDELELGHDLGGVQIEFFNLVCKELLSESANMFTTDATTGFSFFRPGSLQPLYQFQLCGLLFALAIYNGINLPVNFPMAFYNVLLDPHSTWYSIRERWPIISDSLDSLYEEHVPGMEAVFPLEANGLRLTVSADSRSKFEDRIVLRVVESSRIVHHEEKDRSRQQPSSSSAQSVSVDIDSIADAWPGWRLVKDTQEPAEVTADAVPSYTKAYTQWLAFGSVEPQWQAFLKGFYSLLPGIEGAPFPRTGSLRTIVEGLTHLDINELRAATTYEGFNPTKKYVQGFWRIVSDWPPEKQKQLLKFVTAAERIPAGGAGHLTFKISRLDHRGSEDLLPSSSTCFGTLMLPKYSSIEILEKKLSLAIEFGLEGFGTG